MAFPSKVVLDPQQVHTHTLILLHGRGSTAQEFAEDLLESPLESPSQSDNASGSTLQPQNLQTRLPSWRLVFPASKDLHSAIFDEEFPQWFDIASLTDTASRPELQIPGLHESVEYIANIVRQEAELLGGKYGNIVLGGISMGCATAMWTMLKLNVRLGGFVGASGWLPFTSEVTECLKKNGARAVQQETGEEKSSDKGRVFVENVMASTEHALHEQGQRSLLETPVFLGHGTDDTVVDCELGRQARDSLAQIGFTVDWREYEGAEQDGHWFKEPEEVEDIVRFLQKHTVSG